MLVVKALPLEDKNQTLLQNEMTPEYISSLAPSTLGRTTRYRLGNESDLQTIPAKSQQYCNSFLSTVTRALNRLSEETKTAPSITAFKHKLNSDIKSHPNITIAVRD